MSETEQDQRREEDEIPRIYADIELRRTIAGLPQSTIRIWLAFKRLIFLAALGGLFYMVLVPAISAAPDSTGGYAVKDVPEGGRYLITAVVAWMLWDQVFARRRLGTSHILVTTKGVLLTEDNVYLRWSEMESFQNDGKLLRFRLKPGAGPSQAFAPRTYDLPLTQANREFLLDLFREKVERWKPS
ncbi:MAG: hypothetical protein H6807_12135 [Planctomycetes bacterium]|nr:hypothetical protein [Planctomycetota bacterium]